MSRRTIDRWLVIIQQASYSVLFGLPLGIMITGAWRIGGG